MEIKITITAGAFLREIQSSYSLLFFKKLDAKNWTMRGSGGISESPLHVLFHAELDPLWGLFLKSPDN